MKDYIEPQKKLYALVDCNNFYASCEKLFRPELKNKPVVVLSRGGGCIIARSKEAKALGIPMGAPLFEYKDYCDAKGVITFESNFPLYGEMSQRVMETIAQTELPMEVYSIDEAFIELPPLSKREAEEYIFKLRNKISIETGIPVSIGLSHTKTLAKVANHYAKKDLSFCCVIFAEDIESRLKKFSLEDIWGIGKKTAKKLPVFTAYEFIKLDFSWLKSKFPVTVQRIYYELQGVSAILLENMYKTPQSIVVSSTFSDSISDLANLKEALANFCSKGCRKMRKHEIGCRHLNLFVASSRFKENKFFKSGGYSFDSLTNSTLNISQCASLTLESIFKSEVEYKQMGICFLGLERLASNQLPFNSNLYTKNSENLMKALDKINNQYHSEMVRTASSMSSSSKKENKSVKIWNSIPEIQID